MSKVKYFSKGNGLTKLLYMSKNALNWIDYKRCKEVAYPPIIREVDALKSFASRWELVGLHNAFKWHEKSYAEKFAAINESINDRNARLSYRWFILEFGNDHKRDIEQLVIIIGEYMKNDYLNDMAAPTFTRDDYIQIDGELLEKIIVWDSHWADLVPDTQNRSVLNM